MRSLSRRRLTPLIALAAALAQLWLGTLHASAGAMAYCGDGSSGRSAALLRQLPPELRLPLDRLDTGLSSACGQCALAGAAALPTPTATSVLPPLRHAAPVVAQAAAPAATGRFIRPPVRGPPPTR